MKKFLPILLAIAMIFTFVACDQATGGKDPFVAIESTLTEKIESADEIDWNGTWDFVRYKSDSINNITERGYVTISNNITKTTYTYEANCCKYTDRDYYYFAKNQIPQVKDVNITFDDENLCITFISGQSIIDSKNSELEINEFISPFTEFIANANKTAVKTSGDTDKYKVTLILIKR